MESWDGCRVNQSGRDGDRKCGKEGGMEGGSINRNKKQRNYSSGVTIKITFHC